jgi:ParB-like chromosome segregation protein Spo0J
MKIESVPIAKLSLDTANARTHDDDNIAAIVSSLKRFGQQKPIVIDASNVIRAGNGTYVAATQLGWVHIDAVRTKLTATELSAYAIADNRSSEKGRWDDQVLSATLRAIADADEELSKLLGFDDSQLAALLLIEDPIDSPDDFPIVDEDIETEHECPKCNYRWSGKSEATVEADG